jgi:hypothetical protein
MVYMMIGYKMQRKPYKQEHDIDLPEKERPKMPALTFEEVIASMPFFGGEDPEEKEEKPVEKTTTTVVEKSAEKTSAGGDTEIEAVDPKAFAKLQKDLESANKTIQGFTDEKDAAERAKATTEQNLQKDLEDAHNTILQMDAVIQNVAITNAMLNVKDIQWNEVRQAIGELDPEEFEVDMDLANGKATVTGIEKAAQRIAKDYPWLVKNAPAAGNPALPRRGSGSAPQPGTNGKATTKEQRRAELMKKFPVIGHGRVGVS